MCLGLDQFLNVFLVLANLSVRQQLLIYNILYGGSCKHDKLYMNGADISSLLYVKFNTFKIKKGGKKPNQKYSTCNTFVTSNKEE